MNRTPQRAALAFFLPPLEPRVSDVVVDALTQTASNLALDFAQLCQHRLLRSGRVEPREISRRGEHARRGVRFAGNVAASWFASAVRIDRAARMAGIMRIGDTRRLANTAPR